MDHRSWVWCTSASKSHEILLGQQVYQTLGSYTRERIVTLKFWSTLVFANLMRYYWVSRNTTYLSQIYISSRSHEILLGQQVYQTLGSYTRESWHYKVLKYITCSVCKSHEILLGQQEYYILGSDIYVYAQGEQWYLTIWIQELQKSLHKPEVLSSWHKYRVGKCTV